MKSKTLKLFSCPSCGSEFLSKYARKLHKCGSVPRVETDRVEALKAQRAARAQQERSGR